MKFAESEGKFLKGADLQGREAQCVIERIEIETVGDDAERKFAMYLVGKDKGMILNVTNCEILVSIHGESGAGEDDTARLTAHYSGKPICIYFDPTVKYAGKRVGGLRLKRSTLPEPTPREQLPPAPVDEPPHPAEDDGEIPF